MATTKIEWCDHSINPMRFGRGHYCQKISSGCAHCYASRLQPRFGNPAFGSTSTPLPPLVEAVRDNNDGQLWLDGSKLDEVMRRKKPTRYFWCDMTDLFGAWVPDEWIDRCFATMALTPQHTHQVLTKRPERMRDYFAERWQSPRFPPTEETQPRECDEDRQDRILAATSQILLADCGDDKRFWTLEGQNIAYANPTWPLPNVWFGVSVEDQQRADERIPLLLQTPAAVRFLSCEPLLGPITLRGGHGGGDHFGYRDLLQGIGWVIVGSESGPRARPCDLEWVRSIRDQCVAAGVAFFWKQHVENGRKVSLPELDGRQWIEFPEVSHAQT